MSMEQLSLTLPPAETWARPKGKHNCRRDPAAGPGSCWHWWEGCPKAEKRGCYQLWFHQHAAKQETR
ncbi:hypothetical protein [Mesorhizobium sp.]|uniref:hypothetical protein n=1 Tax=Mesorhizobium sp. TaxID=1871066 RepID=UPI0025E76161|nr:hypothetical protein [Mesorhizobium sp.]